MVEKTKIILPIFIQTQPHFIKFKNRDHSYKNHKQLTCTTRIHHSIDTTPCKHQSITNPTIKVTPSIPSQQAPRMTTRPPTTPPSLLFSNSDLINHSTLHNPCLIHLFLPFWPHTWPIPILYLVSILNSLPFTLGKLRGGVGCSKLLFEVIHESLRQLRSSFWRPKKSHRKPINH